MSCWCDEVERYLCNNCEKLKKWKRIKPSDKVTLIAWTRCVMREDTKKEPGFWPFNDATGLCPLDVPDNIWAELEKNNAAEALKKQEIAAQRVKQEHITGLE